MADVTRAQLKRIFWLEFWRFVDEALPFVRCETDDRISQSRWFRRIQRCWSTTIRCWSPKTPTRKLQG